jgi:hypothetical protein
MDVEDHLEALSLTILAGGGKSFVERSEDIFR